ncbi:MAG: formate/nitrite transporter family protein [Lachnospiraceae bacterium]|nr:formate/nitrite transporter family protein [Lachnospiraceae bacterium]
MKSAKEVAENYMNVGKNKVSMPLWKMFLSAVFAGAFIAFGALGSQIAGACIGGTAGRIASACIFPVGLILVVSLGVELFTGNCLLFLPCLAGKITVSSMLKNWGVVYLGNFVGSVLVALAAAFGHTYGIIVSAAGDWRSVQDTAVSKCGLSVTDDILRGILCNVLVCLAVWLAMAATDSAGKLIGTYLPVMLFVLCGFEHSVANMYFIPAGALVASLSGERAGITCLQFLHNLLPVTLGNILGGACIVGGGIFLLFVKNAPAKN